MMQQRFGRYHLRGILGEGGFAMVYRAWDPGLERDVALKVLRPHLAAEPEIQRRFIAEARALARLRHPNIAIVYEVGEEDRQPFFAMELVEGRTLADLVAPGRGLPLEQVATMLASLAPAIDHLHAAKIVHRDIKAANVMLEQSGRVVLMDFGIARKLSSSQHTQPGAVLGTLESMAPEQIRGEAVGPPADIYALGILTYQLLAGRPPFRGDTAHLLYAHVNEPPPPLHELRPGLPESVYQAIGAALAKNPAERPPSARHLAAALAGAISQPGAVQRETTAPPGSRAQPSSASGATTVVDTAIGTSFRGAGPSRRPLVFGGVAVIAVLALLAAVFLRGDPKDTDAETNGEQSQSIAPSSSTPASATVTSDAQTTATTTPSRTATVTPTVTPTATAPATSTAVTSEPATITTPAGGALTVRSEPASAAKPGQGILRVVVERMDGGVRDQFVEVYRVRKDVRGNTVTGDRVASRSTDATGVATFDLGPGDYVVLADLRGYNWGAFVGGEGHADVAIAAGQQTTLGIRLGRLTFTAASVDGGLRDRFVEVYVQQQDVNGTVIRGDRVASGSTDNRGVISFDLVPGLYTVVQDYPGYNWGDLPDGKGQRNIEVKAGEETRQDIRPGRMAVAVRRPGGAVDVGRFVEVYAQKRDANGRTIAGDRVASGSTDSTGVWRSDLIPGSYAVKAGDRTVMDQIIEAEKVTDVAIQIDR